MSSGSRSSSGGGANAEWSTRENKLFEEALVYYGEGTPNRWQKVSCAMGGTKTDDKVRCHYEILDADIKLIESGRVPYPKYNTHGACN